MRSDIGFGATFAANRHWELEKWRISIHKTIHKTSTHELYATEYDRPSW